MEVIIVDDEDKAANLCADLLCDFVNSTPDGILGLPTGSTPLKLYKQLINRNQQDKVKFSAVSTFNLDEYIGVDPSNRLSYRYYMDTHIFNHIDIQKNNTHIPNGMTQNPTQESQQYEQSIQQAGGIDLQILGIGSNGHIGFNEPSSSLASRTRVKTLTRSTIHDNSRLLTEGEFQPRLAITMGIATILEARRIVLLATGKNKAQAIQATVEGPLSAMCPGSALQMHPHTTIIVDEAAASLLTLKDYYKDVYQEKLSIGQ